MPGPFASLACSLIFLFAISLVYGLQQRYPRIVQPQVIQHGELVPRDRRSAGRVVDPGLQYVALGDWLLRTSPSRQVAFGPGFHTEWVGTPRPSTSVTDCESRDGDLQGWPDGESRVLLTRCGDEFFGLVRLGQVTYLVEPLHAGKHLLYEAGPARTRRAASENIVPHVLETGRRYYNLSGDTFANESYEDNPELLSSIGDLGRNNELKATPGISDADELEDFFNRSWQPEKLPTRKTMSKTPPPKWLELAIVADYSVVDFHGSRVQQYLLALFNIVSAIYKDPSLDSGMQIVVVRMILYAEKKDGMVLQGNARRSLENVNQWNRKMRGLSNETHDVAIWLTRLDIGGPSGYAPVSGACDPARSCALNRDEGLTSAFIIAHEVAHILGLSHDGDKNSGNTCAREAVRGSIMAPMVAATFHNFHWSTCSRKEFHRKSKHWTCLLNQPSDYDASMVKGTVNEIFSMDEQCRMEFGEGYSRCQSLEAASLCAHLWCGKANSSQACKTKMGPPLQGTLCAENKWCMNGVCKSLNQKINDPTPSAVHDIDSRRTPESTWSTWSECSGICGIGVRHRFRYCSTVPCEGDSKEYSTCQLPLCRDYVDRRARQCSRFFQNHTNLKKSLSEDNSTWLPYEPFDGLPNCLLICYKKETSEIFHTGLNVEDGTACSYETSNICIDGKCQSMGCDNILGSKKVRDACGVCDGNNSTCENVINKFQRKLRRETTRLSVLPSSAHNVKIAVTILVGDSMLPAGDIKFLVRDAHRKRHIIGNFDNTGRSSVLVIEGAAFRVERQAKKYVFWSRGPISSELVVSLVVSWKIINDEAAIAVLSQYTIAQAELRSAQGRYVWMQGPPGPCSTSCGGGVRRKQLFCRDESTRKLVSRRKCLLVPKPPGYRELEKCNTASCEYTWIVGMWERCTAVATTGGCTGTQRRRLYCVRTSFTEREVTRDNELRVFRNTVSPAKCRDLRAPPAEQACILTPDCNGSWVYTDWSICSQSCGRGYQSRRARCIPQLKSQQKQANDTCGAGPPPPEETRPCKGLARYTTECNQLPTCYGDRGKLCGTRDLITHCRNSAFRRRCCQSCRKK